MSRVVVPTVPGLFSAIGTMLGEIRHDLVQTLLRRSPDLVAAEIAGAFADLEARAADLIAAEEATGSWRIERSADARFEGQLFELTLSLAQGEMLTRESLERDFRAAYRSTYGYDLPEHTVQLVNLRLVATSPVYDGGWPVIAGEPEAPPDRSRHILGEDGTGREVPVRRRASLRRGSTLDGPMIIEDFGATIRVLAGQFVEVRPSGMLIVSDVEGAR